MGITLKQERYVYIVLTRIKIIPFKYMNKVICGRQDHVHTKKFAITFISNDGHIEFMEYSMK